MHLPESTDAAEMIDRLRKKIGKLEEGLDGVSRLLENESFVQNAPPELVEENRARAAEYREGAAKLKSFIAAVS